jgi:class 3 adenylate cyclase
VEIANWLRSLGLEQYGPAFSENNIDVAVLPHLTGEDLKEPGVTTVGHRRKLLNAIATLVSKPHDNSGVHPVVSELVPGLSRVTSGSVTSAVERRQLTVLFCDLVGSTELARSIDPEEYREVLGTYHQVCADTVRRFEGSVAQYLGDGVLAYFGYPQAHEDDAERAARTGLALIEATGRIDPPAKLRMRIGIATGLVVVGDLIGSGGSQEGGIRWRNSEPCSASAVNRRAGHRGI